MAEGGGKGAGSPCRPVGEVGHAAQQRGGRELVGVASRGRDTDCRGAATRGERARVAHEGRRGWNHQRRAVRPQSMRASCAAHDGTRALGGERSRAARAGAGAATPRGCTTRLPHAANANARIRRSNCTLHARRGAPTPRTSRKATTRRRPLLKAAHHHHRRRHVLVRLQAGGWGVRRQPHRRPGREGAWGARTAASRRPGPRGERAVLRRAAIECQRDCTTGSLSLACTNSMNITPNHPLPPPSPPPPPHPTPAPRRAGQGVEVGPAQGDVLD